MAIKDLISPGIGFSPGSVKYIVTRGLEPSGVVNPPDTPGLQYRSPQGVKLHYSSPAGVKLHYASPQGVKLHYKTGEDNP